MDSEIELGPVDSREAVNEAVQVALSKIINRESSSLWGELVRMSGVKDAQKRLTDGQCMRASEEVVKFLFKEHPGSFDLGVILSISNREGKSFKDGDHWGNHTLFLVRDVSGTYFVGSPANLRREKFALKTYEGETVQDVLRNLEKEESGPFDKWNFSELDRVITEIQTDGEQIPVIDASGVSEMSKIRWDNRGFNHNIIVSR